MTFNEFVDFLANEYESGPGILAELSLVYEAGGIDKADIVPGKYYISPHVWIDELMIWEDTPQGEEYWDDVYDDLRRYHGD
jgi:hypothetical protein